MEISDYNEEKSIWKTKICRMILSRQWSKFIFHRFFLDWDRRWTIALESNIEIWSVDNFVFYVTCLCKVCQYWRWEMCFNEWWRKLFHHKFYEYVDIRKIFNDSCRWLCLLWELLRNCRLHPCHVNTRSFE
mgnify:CR=1 FL=1